MLRACSDILGAAERAAALVAQLVAAAAAHIFIQAVAAIFDKGKYHIGHEQRIADVDERGGGQHQIDQFHKQLEAYAGTLKVKAYPKFGKEISTIDVRNDCEKYKEKYGFYPDVVLVDSIDLLTDSSGKSWDNKSLRFKRIAVANDLKDLAGELDAWVCASYQATIEDQKIVDDEDFVLNGYNLSEAKGLQRPCTHLISLNQSRKEYKENTMRLYVAKSRFFRKAEPIKIVTDFEHEVFYNRQATMNLNVANGK